MRVNERMKKVFSIVLTLCMVLSYIPAPAYAVATDFAVTIAEATNGKVEADKTTATEGDAITLTVTADEGYELDTLTVMNGESAVEVNDNSFIMPAANVTISATFKEVASGIQAGYYLVGTLNGKNKLSVDQDSSDRLLKEDTNVEGQYCLEYTFAAGDELKIAYFDGQEIKKWYKEDDFYPISEAKAGKYILLFRPEGNGLWSHTYFTVTPAYSVTVNTVENGAVTADKAVATADETVTLKVTPAEGYELESLTVVSSENPEDPISTTKNENGTYSFVMPRSDVTVSATFKLIPTCTCTVKCGETADTNCAVCSAAGADLTAVCIAEPANAEDGVVEVSTEAELVAALKKGGNIMLTGDITVSDEYGYDITKNTAINLNGHTITGESVFNLLGHEGHEENVVLTISGNGTVKNTDPNVTVSIYGYGTLNILGGTIEGGTNISGTTIMSGGQVDRLDVDKGNSIITGGYVGKLHCLSDGILTISGGYVGELIWSDGILTISGGTFGFDPTAYLAEGYKTAQEDGKWVVTCANGCEYTYSDNGDGTHTATCSVCGHKVTEEHSTEKDENEANCHHGNICDLCGAEYGELGGHTYNTAGSCTVCGAACTHSSFADGKCTVCGIPGGYCGSNENEGGRESLWWYIQGGTLTISGAGDMAIMSGEEFTWAELRDSITALVIDKGVTGISREAFMLLSNLEQVTFAEDSLLTTIGGNAFDGCSRLKEITIPASVTDIVSNPFVGCTAMETVHVAPGNTVYKDNDGVLYTIDGTTLLSYPYRKVPDTFITPKGVTTIGDGAFAGTPLRELELTNDLTTVGETAFANCIKLEKITISSSVKNIAPYAFSPCKALCQVSAPCGWQENPLYDFTSFEIVQAPDVVENIDEHNLSSGVPSEDGLTHHRACSACGYVESTGESHSTTAEGDKAATCTTLAYCSVCDSNYGETSKTNHDASVEYSEADNGFCPNCSAYQPAELKDGYYEISNAGQLYWFADKVDTENDTYGSAKVVLAADITVNEGEITASSTDVRVWNPIGDRTNIFNGTFDGNGKTVSGLYYNNSENSYVGLFARVSERGVVKNVTVTKSYFCGYYNVAGIVGLNEGTVTDCVNRAMMECEGYSGGIVGNNQGNISNCLNYGTIHGSGNQGGIAGYNSGCVELCGNEGSISTGWMQAGGIVGDNTGTVRNCWNTGDVYAKTNCAGGIAGSNIKYSGNTVPVVENCWSTGSVTPVEKPAVGGIVGRSQDSSQNNCYSVMKPVGEIKDSNGVSTVENMEAKTLEQFASGEVAYLLGGVWGQDLDNGKTVQTVPSFDGADVYYGYFNCSSTEAVYTNTTVSTKPVEHNYNNGFCEQVSGQTHYEPATLVTTENCTKLGLADSYIGYYAITNAGQLYWIADKVDNDNANFGAANVVLTDNITVNSGTLTANSAGARVWNPIGRYTYIHSDDAVFSGTFDGNGKTVSGLYYNDSAKTSRYIGLVACVAEGGTVKHVTLSNSYISGYRHTGGIAGENYGTITGCVNNAAIGGEGEQGGIVGENYGTVELCGNTGTITNTWCYSGGIVGYSYGIIRNCWNTGSFSGGTSCAGGIVGAQVNKDSLTENCWSKGQVTGIECGSISGWLNGAATVQNCYSDKDTLVGKRSSNNGDPITTNVQKKFTAAFASGEVAYLLRTRAAAGTNVWGQNLDNGQTVQTVPTFDGADVYYGYTSCGDTEKKYTNNAAATQEKPDHTQKPAYTDNHDGTHSASYSCCGTTVQPEGHNFENEDHQCVCGVIETFTVYWTMAGSLMQSTSTFGQDFAQTFTVPENTHLRIIEVNNRADGTPVKYSFENDTLTIAAEDFPAADIDILCEHYVEVKFDANGGKIKPDDGFPKPDDTGFAEDGSYWVQECCAGGELNPTLNAELLRTGYTFVGWRDASGRVYPMDSSEGKFVIVTEDVTIYAQWQCNHTIGGVEFRDNGDGTHNGYCSECHEPLGNYVARPHVYDETTHQCACGVFKPFTLHAEEQTLDVAYGSDLARALSDVTATKTGYNHTGWTYYYLDEEGTEQPYTGTTMPAKELYAQPVFTPIEYNITWDMAGCSYYVSNYNGLPMKLAYNVDGNAHNVNFTDITAPEGYEFVRFEDGDGNALSYVVTDKYRLNLTVSGDMTVKAVIQPKAYMATWTSVDGGGYEKEFKYGETITIPTSVFFVETFRKAGYTLTGWEGYTEGMTMPIGGVTFTAKWQINAASLAETSGKYTGKAHTPVVTVERLTEGTDFTVTYPEDMVNVGEKVITVTGKLGGTTTVTYTITKADAPVIAFPTVLNEITYRQQVQEAKLSFYENEYGTFNWASPSGYPDGAGERNYALDFYPKDLENYDWAACTWTTHGATWIENRNALCTTAKVIVNRAESIIETEPVVRTLTYTGQPQELVTAGSVVGGTLQYSVNGGEWSESVPTATEAGRYYISYQVVGNSNYIGIGARALPAMEIDQAVLTITAKDHTITYGDTPSDNGIAYDGFVNGETEAVLGGTVTYACNYEQYDNAGTYKITPDGLTADNYKIIFKDGTLTVNKKPITVEANAVSKTYGEAEPTLTYRAEGLVNNDKLTGALTRAEGEDVGTYAIKQGTLTAGNNYTITYTGANLTINAKAITVTADAVSKTYGEAEPTLTHRAEGLVNNDKLTGALTRNEGEDVGAYAIELGTLTAGNNYTITYTGAELTITAKAITKADVALDGSLTYTGDELTQAVTVKGGITYEVSGNKATNVGTYELTVKGTGNYTGEVKLSWSIKPAAATVETAPKANNLTYTGEAQELVTAGTAKGGKLVYGLTENGTYTETIPTGTNAGDYTVWYYVQGDANHADSAKASVKVTIAKAQAEITVDTDPITVTYGDSVELPEATTNFGTVSCDKTANDLVNAGTYTVTYSVAGTDNYDGDTKTVTVTIEKLAVAEPTVTGTYTYTGKEQTVTLTGVERYMTIASGNKGTNAGNYEVVITLDSNHKWADGSDGKVQWSIGKAKAEITVDTDTITVTYGEAVTLPTATTNFGAVTCDKAASDLVNAGTYTVTYSVAGTDNYEGDTKTVTVTINPKTITEADVKLNGSLTYNGKEQTQPITVTADITYEVTGNKATNAGEYELTVKGTGNYTGSVTLDWTIAKAKLTIASDSKVIYIGEKLPMLTYTASGLVGSDKLTKEPTLTTNANADQAGSYTITVTDADAGDNYTIAYVSGSLTIMDKETEVETKIEQTELTEVPEGLKDTQFDTVEEIKEELISKILATSTGYSAENMVHYDVALHFSLDGGDSWVLATEENFPTEGITVILPYPEGTNARDYDFVVSHMFSVTSQRLGITAGDVELPKVEETANGIRVTLNGLSPVTVAARYHDHTGGTATCTDKAICSICGNAYGELDANNHAGGTEVKDAKEATCGAEGYTGDTHCKGCGEIVEKGTAIKATGEHTYGSWRVVKKATKTEKGEKQRTCSVCGHVDSKEIPVLSDTPATGDNSNIVLYSSMFTVSLAGLVVLLLAAKKRKQETA